MEVILPRGRKLELTILRTIAENEGITLTLKTLLESISLNERFVHKFAQQLDEGLLGRFEAPTEVALERFQKKLQDARTELRRQISEIVEHARVVHGFTAG